MNEEIKGEVSQVAWIATGLLFVIGELIALHFGLEALNEPLIEHAWLMYPLLSALVICVASLPITTSESNDYHRRIYMYILKKFKAKGIGYEGYSLGEKPRDWQWIDREWREINVYFLHNKYPWKYKVVNYKFNMETEEGVIGDVEEVE